MKITIEVLDQGHYIEVFENGDLNSEPTSKNFVGKWHGVSSFLKKLLYKPNSKYDPMKNKRKNGFVTKKSLCQ
jgi:hypothetical protein